MRLPSIETAYLEARRTASRFPFVLCCAFAGVIAALRIIHPEPSPESSVAFPILIAAVLGIPLMTALALCAERRQWSRPLYFGSELLVLLLLAGYALTIPKTLPREPLSHMIRSGLLAAGLVLLAMIAPYLKKGQLNGFWQYNRILFLRFLVTGVSSFVLFAGLAIALAALDKLFGVSVPDKSYAELWVAVVGLFSPWFFLSGIPASLDDLDRVEEYPKGLKIFAQYILFSLVIVYLAILYSYLLKILLQWSWPKGWVSSLILGFSATTIISLLLLHPIRDRSENRWIREAGKWLYIVLIPLIAVLFLAVTERISDYGITESRYAGIAFGVWLSALVLYFLFSRSKSIKFTIGSLCLLAFLINFGPWGMLSTSQRSQVERLRKLLTKNGILVDEKVTAEHGKISPEDGREISSIVDYLSRVHGYDAIQPWFSERLKSATGYRRALSPSDVLERMGMDYVAYQGSPVGRTFSRDAKRPIEISGYDRVLGLQSLDRKSRFNSEDISYVVGDEMATLTVTVGNAQAAVQLDIRSFADELLRDYGDADFAITNNMTPDSMAINAEKGGQKVKLLFRRLSVVPRKGKTDILSFTADIAYTVRK